MRQIPKHRFSTRIAAAGVAVYCLTWLCFWLIAIPLNPILGDLTGNPEFDEQVRHANSRANRLAQIISFASAAITIVVLARGGSTLPSDQALLE